MPRIPIIDRVDMKAEQARVYDAAKQGSGIVGGPYYAYIRLPKLFEACQGLRESLSGLMRHEAAAVVSGLPLMTKPLRIRLRLLREALALLRPDAPFVQFTYAVVPPIPRLAGVKVEASERIWRNMPPARVWVYRQN